MAKTNSANEKESPKEIETTRRPPVASRETVSISGLGDTQVASFLDDSTDTEDREFTDESVLEAVASLQTKSSLSPAYVRALMLDDPPVQTKALAHLRLLPGVCRRSMPELLKAYDSLCNGEGEFYAAWCIGLGLSDMEVASRLIERSWKRCSEGNRFHYFSLAHNFPEVKNLAPDFITELRQEQLQDKGTSSPTADSLIFMAPCHESLLRETVPSISTEFLESLLRFYHRFRIRVPVTIFELIRAHPGFDLVSELIGFPLTELPADWDGTWGDLKRTSDNAELSRQAIALNECLEGRHSLNSIAGILEQWRLEEQLPDVCVDALVSLASGDWNGGSSHLTVSQVLDFAALLARSPDRVSAAIPLLHQWKRTAQEPLTRLYARAALEAIAPHTLTTRDFVLAFRFDFEPHFVDPRRGSGKLSWLEKDTSKLQVSFHETAANILAEVRSVQEPILDSLNAWLASLEGQSFPCESAAQQISEITSLVARTGCILIHDEQPVSLYVTTPSDQKNATINVSTLGVRPQRTLLARTKFPPVTARPVDIATDFRQ